jgi:hypothetical protein
MEPRASVTFQCRECRLTWEGAPSRTEDAPDLAHHPWRYFTSCAKCGGEVEQAPWERALMKAWVNATGPKTEEGKAATAKNLEGHPTPEEAKRTRFNAMKHGLNARVATYFPAKPDGYAFCSSCEVSRSWCAAQPACAKQTELFMLHNAAFEQRDPKKLTGIYSELQAGVFAIIQMMVQQIVADGVKIDTVVWDKDVDGNVKVAEYVDESGTRRILRDTMQANPLLNRLGELLSRTGLSLADMGMTTKVIEQNDGELGQLAADQQKQEQLTDFQKRQTEVLEKLAGAMERGRKATAHDPVLLDYNQATGEAKEVRPLPNPPPQAREGTLL